MAEETMRLPSKDQIETAIKLHTGIGDWKRKDEALEDLKQRDSGFLDPYEILLKILAVNQFYSAGCSDILGMKDHLKRRAMNIIEEYENNKNAAGCVALVEAIALQGKEKKKYGDGCPVFASKFAYFFIDKEAFPILDTHAERIVQFHLGQRSLNVKRVEPSKGQRYKTFYTQFVQLKEKIHAQSSPRIFSNKELDQYLWLAGISEKLMHDRHAEVNGDVKKKFLDPATQPLFAKLFPYQKPS